MDERPEQRPEGRLLEAALKDSGLSIREASRRAGMSYGRWRQITTSVQHVSPGSYGEVKGPPERLARMALVVGVTPEQFEQIGTQRCMEAAAELRKLLARQQESEARQEGRPKSLRYSNPEKDRIAADVWEKNFDAQGAVFHDEEGLALLRNIVEWRWKQRQQDTGNPGRRAAG
jgi:hypothetical protein